MKGETIKSRTAKHLIFIRHGESTWNETFNRGKAFLLPRLIYSAFYELYLIISGAGDSWFYDSPLSHVGRTQAETVRNLMRNPDKANNADVKVLNGTSSDRSIVVCSNLRRCISTALICMWDRLARNEERVMMIPALQEATINPDGLAITPAGRHPRESWMDKTFGGKGYDMARAYSRHVDSSLNTGSKALDSNGLKRMGAFNNWLFDPASAAATADTVIVAGHSLWFKSYFATFHPDEGIGRNARRKKMKNCATVAFTVERIETQSGKVVIRIDPMTTRVVHLGFKK